MTDATPNPFQIYGTRNYCVSPVKGGYRVMVRFCPGSDEMWETLSHFALFESEVDAESLLRKVQAKRGELDLNYWHWTPSKSTPFTALQNPPVAKLETTPRPMGWRVR